MPVLTPDGTVTEHWKYPVVAFQAQAAALRDMPGPASVTRTWPALPRAAAQLAAIAWPCTSVRRKLTDVVRAAFDSVDPGFGAAKPPNR